MKKKNKLNLFVIGTMVYFVLFVIAMTVIFCIKGSVPDTLIQYGLGGGGIELACSTVIQFAKKKYEKEEDPVIFIKEDL